MEHALEHQYYFKEILIVLTIAGIIVPVFQRLKISSILCYLITGIVIGPFGLALFSNELPLLSYIVIDDPGWVQSAAEFGVMLLLFMIGLELSITRLWDLRRKVFGLGGMQILVSTLVIGAIAHSFNNSVEVSILIGASLALSSTATVMQLLKERSQVGTESGTTAFSILLMQDMAVVPILMLLAVFAGQTEGSVTVTVLITLLQATLTIAAIFFIGRKLLRPLLQYFGTNATSEWIMAVSLLISLGTAALTYEAGLSLALGAFLAGLLIAETEYRHEVEIVIDPLKSVFMGIFFLSVGMMIDIRAIIETPFWIPVSVIGIFMIKGLVIAPLCMLFRVNLPSALEVALLLGQGGEFAFLIVGMALTQGMIPQENAQFFLIVTALTMILTPSIADLANKLKERLEEKLLTDNVADDAQKKERELYVLIIGFGRVGHTLSEVLNSLGIAYIGVENNSLLVSRAKLEGHTMIYGDARRSRFWNSVDLDRVNSVVVTVDNPRVSHVILRAIRKRSPLLPVIVRARHESDMAALYDAGATRAIPEMLEGSLLMGQHLLQELCVPETRVREVMEEQRVKHAELLS